jgi:hypothetical protein
MGRAAQHGLLNWRLSCAAGRSRDLRGQVSDQHARQVRQPPSRSMLLIASDTRTSRCASHGGGWTSVRILNRQHSRVAASASIASPFRYSKKAGLWPMKSPIAVKKLTTPIATPVVSVGRIMEQTGSARLRNGHGSGIMRLVWNSSPPKGAELRSGKVSPLVGSVRGPKGRDHRGSCLIRPSLKVHCLGWADTDQNT